MICLKIRTFVVSATTATCPYNTHVWLWFAWKFVPLWYQQQRMLLNPQWVCGCDLLENSYLCGISNNLLTSLAGVNQLWFAWKFVPLWYQQQQGTFWRSARHSCDLLENSYLCGISNNFIRAATRKAAVVICLKIRTFVVSATTKWLTGAAKVRLWFAWKFVPLWYQQQHLHNHLNR